MNLLSAMFVAAEEGPHRDDNGQIVTHHWLLPETEELIWGTAASIIIFALLWKFAWPAIKNGLAARTARIQAELDSSAEAFADATAEAERIRTAKGDIDAERQRLFAEADETAAAVLSEGRRRLEEELAALEARAEADLALVGTRAGDEMRAEIARVASDAMERIVGGGLDDTMHQALIENFIAKVGQS
jgi:F-type H+-transporting ATPase subunit b